MIRNSLVVMLLVAGHLCAMAQKTEHVILITLDGFRWQELFQGADSSILFNDVEYIKDKTVRKDFWDSSEETRRQKLMPFFWTTIVEHGQLYGNRVYNNHVNCANPHWFSYPGYSELLVGFVDRRIRSNDTIVNPNSTVLEFIASHPQFRDSVAVFSTWDAMPYIVRASENDIFTNCGRSYATGESLTDRELQLNELQRYIKNPYGSRYDAFTFQYAHEYLKRRRPRVMFISLDETDEHGHGGRYDQYLRSANKADAMIRQLWEWLQTDAQYANKTTLIITTDHGRGKGAKRAWKNHGRLSAGSSQMWFAVIGPDTPALGEMKQPGQYFQKQIAKTIADFLGLDYVNTETVGDAVNLMMIREKITMR
jgi:Type I phosphodiesterase / nucleotide pyrophosphatase